MSLTQMKTPGLVFEFGEDSNTMDWYIVNDGVMGGLSQSKVEYTAESLKFSGRVSLENNGGFASIRSPFRAFDLSQFETVKIKYRSTNQDLGFVFAPYRRWYYPNYKIILTQTDDNWKIAEFNLKDFKEYKIGKLTGNTISEDLLQNIIRLGLITQTKSAGPFTFEIEYIKFE